MIDKVVIGLLVTNGALASGTPTGEWVVSMAVMFFGAWIATYFVVLWSIERIKPQLSLWIARLIALVCFPLSLALVEIVI